MVHGICCAVEQLQSADDHRDLSGLRVLGNVRVGVRRNDQQPDRIVGVVPDLVTAFLPARERYDVTL
jgi:hypothetical protein